MGLTARALEAGIFVDVPGDVEMALRPEGDFFIASFAREVNAFVHEAAPDAEASRTGLDVQ